MDGMQMMLKSLGIDPAKIMGDFTALKNLVDFQLKEIHKKLDNIEGMQKTISSNLEQLCQMNKTALSMTSQVRAVPGPPQNQLSLPPQSQEQQSTQQNQQQ